MALLNSDVIKILGLAARRVGIAQSVRIPPPSRREAHLRD